MGLSRGLSGLFVVDRIFDLEIRFPSIRIPAIIPEREEAG